MAAGRRLVRCAGTRLPFRRLLLLLVALLAPGLAGGTASEPGRWKITAGGNQTENVFVLSKTMFSGTSIIVKFLHERCNGSKVFLDIAWYLRSSRCHNDVYINENEAISYLKNHEEEASAAGDGQYIWQSAQVQCSQLHELPVLELPKPRKLKPLPGQEPVTNLTVVEKHDAPKPPDGKKDKKGKEARSSQAHKEGQKATEEGQAEKPSAPADSEHTKKKPDAKKTQPEHPMVPVTWDDGPYVFILSIKSQSANWELSRDWFCDSTWLPKFMDDQVSLDEMMQYVLYF